MHWEGLTHANKLDSSDYSSGNVSDNDQEDGPSLFRNDEDIDRDTNGDGEDGEDEQVIIQEGKIVNLEIVNNNDEASREMEGNNDGVFGEGFNTEDIMHKEKEIVGNENINIEREVCGA